MASRFSLALSARAIRSSHTLDLSSKVLMIPALFASAMLIVGFTAANIARVDGTSLLVPYIAASGLIAFMSLLIANFIAFARLARVQADRPIARVRAEMRARWPLLLLPCLIFPLFLAGFTTAKTAIPYLVGFGWDAFWADADKLLFGNDAWRIAHSLISPDLIRPWEMLYSVGWTTILFLFMANVALYANIRRVGVIYTAMLASWILGGWFMAYATSSAGPVFVHLVDPALAERFAPLRATLDSLLSADSTTRLTQAYLAFAMDLPVAVKGGGISAMPSMHLAAVTIYLLAARDTWWLAPAIAYWLIIFLGSAYFGYHYWVDGLAAAAIAWACWALAEAAFRERAAPGEPA